MKSPTRHRAQDRTPSVKPRLEVVHRPLHQLRPHPSNPRSHPPHQIKQIARSIQAFGFNVPILIDDHDGIVAGHARLLAAKELGLQEVPTIRLSHLAETQARAFLIAENRLTEQSRWDKALLGQHFKALAEVDLSFSPEATGFDLGEIDVLIEGLEASPKPSSDPSDSISEAASGPVVTQEGDLWLAGEHRVLCGHALDAQAYQRLMAAKRATVVFSDPPYNVPIAGHASGLGRITHRDFAMASGELSEPQFTAFLTDALTHLAAHSQNGSLHYLCMDWRHLRELLTAGRSVYSELKNVCVWVKDHPGMGSLYRSQHELIAVFKHGTAAHRNHIQLGKYGRTRSNVWHYPSATSFSRATDEGHLLSLHPTVKPVQLVADVLLDCSTRRDIVLDAFLGSGTSLIAAQRTGRVAYGIELDPRYVDTAIRRWQAYTGDSARHATSGKLFDELEAEQGGHDGD